MISFYQSVDFNEKIINDLAKEIYSFIKKGIHSNQIGLSIEKRLKEINSSFEHLIKIPFDDLLGIERKYGKVSSQEKKYLIKLYEKLRSNFGVKIIEKLKVNTCLYCNIHMVLTYDKAEATFDHFYPKSKHPLLSISLFNLIPICSYCNQKKGEKVISYSPYNKNIFTDRLLAFKLNYKSKEEIEIIINILNNVFNGNVEVLCLSERYDSKQIKAFVCKLIRIIQTAPNDRSEDEIKNYLMYDNEQDYIYNNLSKLKHDIIDQFLHIKNKTY